MDPEKKEVEKAEKKTPQISKDGLAFIGLTGIMAVGAGSLGSVISGLAMFIAVGAGVMWCVQQMKGDGKKRPFYELNVSQSMERYGDVEAFVFRQMQYPGESEEHTFKHFLARIRAQDPTQPIRNYFSRPIFKKMLWEYKRKYGNLEYPILSGNYITPDDILRPLSPEECQQFILFCSTPPCLT